MLVVDGGYGMGSAPCRRDLHPALLSLLVRLGPGTTQVDQLQASATCRLLSTPSIQISMAASIDSETLEQYLADSPPTIVPLAIKPHFDALTDKEKLYAHHISM